jgi:hypothetical protein
MSDAKPVLTILILSGCGLLWLVLESWVGVYPMERLARLLAIAAAEEPGQAVTLPTTLRAQADWLCTHRLRRLQGVSVLVVLSALIGFWEGVAWRRRDPQAGMGLRHWTLGLMSGALAPGLVGGLVLAPFPWSLPLVASAGAVWSGATLFLLARGRPSIA